MSDPVSISGDLADRINKILERLKDVRPMLNTIGRLGAQSVRKNFDAGGRPNIWAPLKHRDGQPLRDTGRLQGSFAPGAPGSIFELEDRSVSFGTNVTYAAVHNFGAGKGEFGTVTANVAAHSVIGHTRQTKNGTVYVGPHNVQAHTRKMLSPFGDIPAREFLLLQSSDVDDAQNEAESHVMGD